MDKSPDQINEQIPSSESNHSERGFNTPKLRELQFQNVLSNVDNGIVFLDKEFNVLYINQRCKDIWEYPDGLDYDNITLYELIDASLNEADFTDTELTDVE
ncbi:MAG: PAS-domain containing protein [Rhizobiaceae bacterium]|nr:PAS-domain containing protein [Rhizobiaceae bacterium]